MLVLSRRVGEKIVIGKNKEISITMLSVKGSSIQIGVSAAKEIPIWREELVEEVRTGLSKDTMEVVDHEDD